MGNNSRTHECLTKFCSYVTTGRVFQIALGVGGISLSRGNGKFCWTQNSSLSSFRLKINMCILELSILFSKDLLFLYYMQVIRFWFFLEKNWSFSYISLFYFALDMSLISWCMLYDTQFIFFQKWRKLLSQTSLDSKLKFLQSFSKNKKWKKGLKCFARIKFWKKGKLKLGKI